MGQHDGEVAQIDHASAGRAGHEVVPIHAVDRLAGDRILFAAEDLASG
jgi:hypothetical protein